MTTEAVPAAAPERNEVLLTGRLAAPAERRELPSGDVLVAFRVVVGRPPAKKRRERAPTIDTLDCVAWDRAPQRAVLGWQPGDVVEVTGALRRRFWRAGAAAASRTEVEVAKVRRVARAG